MPTLADALRGYTPPTESPMTDVVTNYVSNIPKKFNENQAYQMDLLNRAFPGNTYESMMTQGDPKAMSELAMQVPVIGMTKALGELPKDYHELNTMVTRAYDNLRKSPNSKEAYEEYMSLRKARDVAPLNNPNQVAKQAETVVEDYKGQHQAPMMDSGKPLHDLTDVYPEDFYSHKAVQYYGTGSDRDAYVISQLQSLRGKPNAEVWMYRAVPKNAESAINKGDWVTTDRQYAKEHGESALNGDYKIIKRKAYARDLYTNGDSPFEMGYDPQPMVKRKALIEEQVNKLKD